MKKLSILGSTGTIGKNTLDVVRRFPELFRVLALSAGSNVELLEEQIREFSPRLVVIGSLEGAERLKKKKSSSSPEILWGRDGLDAASTMDDVDLVISAITGAAGLIPTFAAVKAGKDVALANKESLVLAGDIIMKEAHKSGSAILPVDSEHSAVFQSMKGQKREDIKRIILTASGGPFLNHSMEEMQSVTPEDALNHPRWLMGSKVTIDSATLMNKGLEVIEARWLFDLEPDKIDVCIHPESVIHSMIEYNDRTIMAHMSYPDMRGPISYALGYPERLDAGVPRLDFGELKSLTFQKPDNVRFPCLGLAYRALRTGGTMPAVLNAADEVAVGAFLKGEIPFIVIPDVIESVMERHMPLQDMDIKGVLEADGWARKETSMIIKRYERRKI